MPGEEPRGRANPHCNRRLVRKLTAKPGGSLGSPGSTLFALRRTAAVFFANVGQGLLAYVEQQVQCRYCRFEGAVQLGVLAISSIIHPLKLDVGGNEFFRFDVV